MLRAIAFASSLVALSASAGTIAQWNFNSVPPNGTNSTGSTSPIVGSGTFTGAIGGVTGGFTSANTDGNSSDSQVADDTAYQIATFAAQGTENKLRGIEFKVSTLGLENITINFDQRSATGAPNTLVVQYSTNGISFTDAATLTSNTSTWLNSRLADLSAISAVDNQTNVWFRFVAAFGNATQYLSQTGSAGGYNVAGTWRFDMLTVSGTAIPPVTVVPLPPAALAGAALVAFLPLTKAIRRRA